MSESIALNPDGSVNHFAETGTGGNSAFQPVYGNPQLEESYLSFMVNQKPALRGVGLKATIAAINDVWGAQLGRAPGPRNVVQLDTNDNKYYSSSDVSFLRFQKDVADALNNMFTTSEQTDVAVTGWGLPRDFSKLYTSGAIAMNPTISPRIDKIGVPLADLPSDYMRVLRLVAEIYSEEWSPASIQQNNKSHAGILCDTRDKAEKVNMLVSIVNRHGSEYAEKLVDLDGGWFAAEYGAFPVTKITARWQLDAIGKVREGEDWRGFWKVADKSVPANIRGPFSEMTAARQRVAYAVCTMSNSLVAPMFSGWRSIALEEYAETWHTSVDADMLDPINKYGNYSLYDAKNFDTTYAREELDEITDALIGVTDLGRDYIKRVSHLPLLISSDTRGEAGAYLINNSSYAAGHQSGVSWVSDYNKIRGTAQWLYGVHKVGYLNFNDSDEMLKNQYRKILKHEDSNYAMINQGDDTMALSSSKSRLNKWCEAVEAFKFAIWERDEGRKMIGKVIYQSHVGAPLKVIPDAVTLVEKLIINERSVHSKHRPMSSAGNLKGLVCWLLCVQRAPKSL
jgi:hypothetical protein